MATRNILKMGDETLEKKSRLVTDFDSRLHELLDDMTETMIGADGLGLAAPQVGVLRRVFVVLQEDNTVLELVNPEIVKIRGEQNGIEGCLSFPGVYGKVSRPFWVKVKYQDRFGIPQETSGEGIYARAFCHEMDHLDGVLFTDLASEIVDELDEAAIEERSEVRYDVV